MNGWMDLDDTHICYGYWWDGKVDPSQGHKLRGQGHICIYGQGSRAGQSVKTSCFYISVVI